MNAMELFGETIPDGRDCLRLKDNNSLCVRPSTGQWYDFSTGKGGDLFSWVMQEKKCSFPEAKAILEKYGVSPVTEYKCGTVTMHRERTEDGKRFWQSGNNGALHQLYKVNEAIAHAGDTIYICEGEKCADALWGIDKPAVTSLGGAQRPQQSNWNPLVSCKKKIVIIPDCDAAGEAYAQFVHSKLPQSQVIRLNGNGKYDIADYLNEFKNFDELKIEDFPKEIPAWVSCVFHPAWDNEPPAIPPVVTWHGTGILDACGIWLIVGPEGGNKTTVIGAMAAARINPAVDSFGLKINTSGNVVMIDTEQKRREHHALWKRTMRIAGIVPGAMPQGVRFDCITGLSKISARRDYLQSVFDEKNALLLLDGFGDFVSNVNDVDECEEFVSWLTAECDRTETAIAGTLHHNPNAQDDQKKGRGHLGSILARKAQSNALLKKDRDTGVRTLTMAGYSHAKNRSGAETMESHFCWNEERKLFITCDAPETSTRASTTDKYFAIGEALQAVKEQWSYGVRIIAGSAPQNRGVRLVTMRQSDCLRK